MNDDLKTELERVKAQLDAANRREKTMREAIEHALAVSECPTKYGRYLTENDRYILRDALQPDAGKEQP